MVSNLQLLCHSITANEHLVIRSLCLQVFITGPETTGDSPEKLEREEKVKVFDNKKFWAQLQRYMSEGRLKTPEVRWK